LITDDTPYVEYFRSLPRGDPPDPESLRSGDAMEIVKR
jgi:hypothetical protein